MTKYSTYLLLIIMPLCSLSSCFTGVESTPRITRQDVKKENISVTPEQLFLKDISSDKPALWQKNKTFYVTDDKITLVLSAENVPDTLSLSGQFVFFDSLKSVTSVTGQEMPQIDFYTSDGLILSYRPEITFSDFTSKDHIEIPFLIDMDVVREVGENIKGKTYYITTPLWYTADGTGQRKGKRHVAVSVKDVQPGDSNYPLRVIFSPSDTDDEYSVFMSVGEKRTATRNFDTLFAFDNPRVKYPRITDETWQLIVNSRVRPGMTKDECRLALGAPKVQGQRPTTAGMVEYWQYPDGLYLIFEEGLLSVIR